MVKGNLSNPEEEDMIFGERLSRILCSFRAT